MRVASYVVIFEIPEYLQIRGKSVGENALESLLIWRLFSSFFLQVSEFFEMFFPPRASTLEILHFY